MAQGYRFRLVLEPQPEGGFLVTSPDLPELVTEGDTLDEAMENAKDAFSAVLELYEDQGREFPVHVVEDLRGRRIVTEQLVSTA